MPFRSEAQRRWMWANNPEMAHRWSQYSTGGDINVTITTDIGSMSGFWRTLMRRAPQGAHKAAVQMAKDLVKLAQERASGRPGPSVITGAYRSSIRIFSTEDTRYATNVFVGTDAPQAHRLEFGFVGVDSLGRHYHQPAFPHWRPALAEIQNRKAKYVGTMRSSLL